MSSTSNHSKALPVDEPVEHLLDQNANTNNSGNARHVSNLSADQPASHGAPVNCQHITHTSSISQPKLALAKYLGFNIFIWARAFGIAGLVMSTAVLLWFLAPSEHVLEEPSFARRLVCTFSGLGILVAVVLLLNAFVFHRSMVYMVLAIIHAFGALFILGLFVFVGYVFVVEIGECAKYEGSICDEKAKYGLAWAIVSLTAAFVVQAFSVCVLAKAAVIQGAEDGISRDKSHPRIDADTCLREQDANTNDSSQAGHFNNVSAGQPRGDGAPADDSPQIMQTSSTSRSKPALAKYFRFNIFIWARAFGITSLIVSTVILVRLLALREHVNEDTSLAHRFMFTSSGFGIVMAVILLLNAFVFHRSVVYVLLSIIHAFAVVLVLVMFIYASSIFAAEHDECANRVGSDCDVTEKEAVALVFILLVAAFVTEGLLAIILAIAAVEQNKEDGVNLDKLPTGAYADTCRFHLHAYRVLRG